MPSPEAVNPKSISALANRKDVTLEKILVPIDFSENASAAIDYADLNRSSSRYSATSFSIAAWSNFLSC
jgi:hypothetical protein